MNYLKSLFIAAISLSTLGLTAQAQYAPVPLLVNQYIASGATSNYTATADLDKASGACVAVQFKLTGAGSGNVVASFSLSADGANYETTPSISVTNTANGTNKVVGISSEVIKNAKRIKLVSIANSGGAICTNIYVTVGIPLRYR